MIDHTIIAVSDNLAAYAGTKFAVRGITQAAAGELGRHKITVNAYAPGLIDTQMSESFRRVFQYSEVDESHSSRHRQKRSRGV